MSFLILGHNIRWRTSICAVCKKDISQQERRITAFGCCNYCEDCNTRYGQCKLITTCIKYYDNGEFDFAKKDCWNFKKECDVKSIMMCQSQHLKIPIDRGDYFDENGKRKPYTKAEIKEKNKDRKGNLIWDECDDCVKRENIYARENGVGLYEEWDDEKEW